MTALNPPTELSPSSETRTTPATPPEEASLALRLAENGTLPDAFIRLGIRRLLRDRLKQCAEGGVEAQGQRLQALLDEAHAQPIAVDTQAANDQHYEVPPTFFEHMLGPRLKYSGCHWPENTQTLAEAEDLSVAQVAERADLQDGQHILELGCGWGSMSLYMAERFPNARITAVSNSADQRRFIGLRAAERGLTNLTVITRDANQLELPERAYDRVVSIEMMEHARNHGRLLSNIHQWLKPGGKLFVHVFTHHRFCYHFETDGDDNWMGRHFFTGGIMPSHDYLPLCAQAVNGLDLETRWAVSGTHYQKTAEAWLKNLDEHKSTILKTFAETYGQEHAARWHQRWRIFVMACAELWGYRGGNEWHISHYRWTKAQDLAS